MSMFDQIPGQPVAVRIIQGHQSAFMVETAHLYVHERGISFADLGYGTPAGHHVIHAIAGTISDPERDQPAWGIGENAVVVGGILMPEGFVARHREWMTRVGIGREDVWQAIRDDVARMADVGERII